MGYTLRIGELEASVEYEGLESYIHLDAKPERKDDAPAYGEPTDHTNSRWPSYTSWSEFTRFAGLHYLMYNEEVGLLRKHPGCVPLVKEHKEIIDKAYQKFYDRYPNAKAGYSPKIDFEKRIFEDTEWPVENGMAARLEWLKYWVDWALENCEKPVFYNS